MKKMSLGIQLYTLREFFKDDYKGTLRKAAAQGWDGFEFAGGFGGMEPEELGDFVKELGVACCGMHSTPQEFLSGRAFEYAKALNAPFVTFSCCAEYPAALTTLIPDCNAVGARAYVNHKIFTYHNHHREFARTETGEYCLDNLFRNTDHDRVGSELDVYWVAKGGADPVEYVKKYADRIHQLHMKDMDKDDGSWTELGNGIIDLAGCIAAAEPSVCSWLIYEQDACKRNPLESAEISLAHLRKLTGR